MLKKLAKRIELELHQAEDYAEQMFLVKHKSSSTADLFASLCGEEIEHAEKLLKEGQRLVNDMSSDVIKYLDEDSKDGPSHDKCKIIWDWETRLAMTDILNLKYKLSQYRSTR